MGLEGGRAPNPGARFMQDRGWRQWGGGSGRKLVRSTLAAGEACILDAVSHDTLSQRSAPFHES